MKEGPEFKSKREIITDSKYEYIRDTLILARDVVHGSHGHSPSQVEVARLEAAEAPTEVLINTFKRYIDPKSDEEGAMLFAVAEQLLKRFPDAE
jgi:hypothetical protein